MKLKTFVLSIIMLLSMQLTIQATTLEHEKPNITITNCLDDGMLQIATSFANQNIHNHYQGLDIYHIESRGHLASITSCRYGKNNHANKTALEYTHGYKKQPSYNFITQNRQRNPSRMYLRGTQASGEIIQRNSYQTNRNYKHTKRNHYHFAKPNEFFTKNILLHRIGCCSYCDRLHREGFYQTVNPNFN